MAVLEIVEGGSRFVLVKTEWLDARYLLTVERTRVNILVRLLCNFVPELLHQNVAHLVLVERLVLHELNLVELFLSHKDVLTIGFWLLFHVAIRLRGSHALIEQAQLLLLINKKLGLEEQLVPINVAHCHGARSVGPTLQLLDFLH